MRDFESWGRVSLELIVADEGVYKQEHVELQALSCECPFETSQQ